MRKLPLILLLVDILAIVLAHHFAYTLRLGTLAQTQIPVETLIIGAIFLASNYCLGGYFINKFDVRYRLAIVTFLANGMALILSSTVIYWFAPFGITLFFGRGVLLITFLLLVIPTIGSRLVLVWFTKKKLWQMTWHCIGSKKHFEQLFIDYQESGDLGLKLNYLGDYDSIDPVQLENNRDDGLLLLNENELTDNVLSQLTTYSNQWRGIMSVSQFYEYFWQMEPGFYIREGYYAYEYSASQLNHAPSRRVKRLVDIVFGGCLLFAILPLMLGVALLIKLTSPGPVFYQQQRVGKRNQVFRLYKFRSMQVNAEQTGAKWAVKNDDRITPVGRWLRILRLDELPQLWNVLIGEMSLIGPRPERPEFVEGLAKEIAFYDLRHVCKPGLSGWAQVKYPYGASVEDARKKLQYDLYYIKHYSFLLDVWIALKTLKVILLAKGR